MDVTWQSSLDRTLRSTAAGAAMLESLQNRRATYDRAKRKIDDYLGASPNRGDDKSEVHIIDQDLSLPPPLPQHLRYHAARMTGPSPPGNPPLDDSTPIRRPSSISSSPLQLLGAQMRGVLLELELEKAKRADSVRELAFRTTAEIAEMRSLITQLQTENAALKKSVRAIEGRLGYEASTDGLRRSVGNGETKSSDGVNYIILSSEAGRSTKAATSSPTVSSTGFGHQHSMRVSGGEATSLVARVEALESGLARQKQMEENREARTTGALRELIKSEVNAEMTQVRAVAREAARGSAEDLLKLRLSEHQSITQAGVEKALHTASASEALAQQTQQQCRETEQRLSSHMHRIQVHMAEWQRGDTFSDAAPSSSRQKQERLANMESRISDELRGMQSRLTEYRAEVQAQVDHAVEQLKALSGVVQGKAEVADCLAISKHLEETQRASNSGWMSREQVTALLQTQLHPLNEEVCKMQTRTHEGLDTAEAWRRTASVRFVDLEATLENTHNSVTQQETQIQSLTRDILQMKADFCSVQSRIAEAVQRAKTELADAWDTRVRVLDERAQQLHRENQQLTDKQCRQLQQTLSEQKEALQRARGAGESAEERLRRVEAALAAAEAALSHAVEDARVKHEALQSVMQQTCVLPLSRAQQDVEAVQRVVQAMEEDWPRRSSNWVKQLMEARQYHEERAQHTREVLEQRLVHQKELYEEQHQQLLNRIRYIQEQQQISTLSVVAPTRGRERVAEIESVSALEIPVTHTVAETSAPAAYQRALQGVLTRCEALDNRIGIVEEQCAKVSLIVTDATAPIATCVEALQDRLQTTTEEWRQRHQELKTDMELQLGALSRRCSETEASIEAHSKHTTQHIEQMISPKELVSHLSTDKSSLHHLSAHLRAHLTFPSESTVAMDGMRAQLATHETELSAMRAAMQDSKKSIVELSELCPPHKASDVVTSSHAGESFAKATDESDAQQSTVNALRDLRVALDEQRKRQDDLEVSLQRLSAQELATVTRELAELKRVTDGIPREIEQLSDQYTALQSTQRQQFPTLQKYVHDIFEMIESNHSTLLDPVQLRLRAVEDHHKHLQARLEELSATHEADAEERTHDFHKKMAHQHLQHKAVEEQLSSLRDDVAVTRASIDFLEKHMAVSKQPGKADAEAQCMAPMGEVEESTQRSTDPPVARPVASAEELRSLFQEIDERLTLLEEQTQESMSVTSDMMGAFRDQLQNVVEHFADAASEHISNGEETLSKGTNVVDPLATEAVTAVAESVCSSAQPPLRSFEDVLLFLLHGLRKLQQALTQLQSNTVDTLEILEQHEESIALLPTLQHTVDAMTSLFVPLAERLGVGTGAVCAAPELQQTLYHHDASLFAPPYSSDSSSSSGVNIDEKNVASS